MPQLPPGEYEVSVSMAGFDTAVRIDVTLYVGQEATLNFSMKLGSIALERHR